MKGRGVQKSCTLDVGGADHTRGMADRILLGGGAISGRGRTLNPFVIVDDARGFIDFAVRVLGAEEVSEARTPTPSGTLIHAELRIGDALLLLADALPGWTPRPGLFQIWVADVQALVSDAIAHGAALVTPPTPFYGALTLARIEDPWGNLWWCYEPVPGQSDPRPVWEGGSDTVFRTLDEHLRGPGPVA